MLTAKHAAIRYIVRDMCATLRPSLKGFLENLGVDFNNSVSDTFCLGFFGAHFHADTAIKDNTPHFSGGTAFGFGGASTKGEDIADSGMALSSPNCR